MNAMMPKMMFGIRNWNSWDHRINAAVEEFRMVLGLSPNIILCNRITFSRIDIIARKEKIADSNGDAVGGSQYCRIEAFVGPDYELTFCVDEALSDKHFALLYDLAPDGGGEPMPDDLVKGFRMTGTA